MYHEGVKFFHKNNSQRISIIYLSLRKASCLNFPMVSHVQIHTIHLCRYGWFPHKRRQPTITQLVSNYKAIQTKITETKNLNTTIRDTKSFKNQLYNSLKKSEKKSVHFTQGTSSFTEDSVSRRVRRIWSQLPLKENFFSFTTFISGDKTRQCVILQDWTRWKQDMTGIPANEENCLVFKRMCQFQLCSQ